MTMTAFHRRRFLAGAATAFLAPTLPVLAGANDLTIHVMKDPDCGCCGAWIEILRRDGFAVTIENLGPEQLRAVKLSHGIAEAMMSCHTGQVGGYVIEGHVPAADIRRLLTERPEAIGLSVPGMPYGSPGMGPEDERDAYDVFLILRDGKTELFSRYDAA